MVGSLLALSLPAVAGKAPTGLNSGVTVGGSTLLPIGAAFVAGEEIEIVESASPNATVDPATGEITLTAAAQQQINQAAIDVLQSLQISNPSLANTLTIPGEIALGSPSPVGASGVGEDEDSPVDEIAAAVAAAIANGESVSLTSTQGTLGITAPAVMVDPAGGPSTMGTSAVFVPPGGTPMVMPLQGSQAQIANAAGLLAAAFASGLAPNQVASFVEMALVGADYRALVPLFNAVGGLLLQPQPPSATINATQLEAAIQAYNRMLNDSDAETLVALAQNSDFVVLGQSLQQLRAAIDR
ncbi:MAG: hypothetical protein EA368_16835 [Leptolyngbya sp. DLM2.Bin27]|nr:MAG: hypothetical protein EA368_16835 [Leptolyngbya sp. DLM2.Bin27]